MKFKILAVPAVTAMTNSAFFPRILEDYMAETSARRLQDSTSTTAAPTTQATTTAAATTTAETTAAPTTTTTTTTTVLPSLPSGTLYTVCRAPLNSLTFTVGASSVTGTSRYVDVTYRQQLDATDGNGTGNTNIAIAPRAMGDDTFLDCPMSGKPDILQFYDEYAEGETSLSAAWILGNFVGATVEKDANHNWRVSYGVGNGDDKCLGPSADCGGKSKTDCETATALAANCHWSSNLVLHSVDTEDQAPNEDSGCNVNDEEPNPAHDDEDDQAAACDNETTADTCEAIAGCEWVDNLQYYTTCPNDGTPLYVSSEHGNCTIGDLYGKHADLIQCNITQGTTVTDGNLSLRDNDEMTIDGNLMAIWNIETTSGVTCNASQIANDPFCGKHKSMVAIADVACEICDYNSSECITPTQYQTHRDNAAATTTTTTTTTVATTTARRRLRDL